MKKLLTVLICLLLVLGVNVSAAKKKTTKNNTAENTQAETEVLPEANRSKVKIYVFTKEECPYCEKAKTYLSTVEQTFGKYFETVVLEVYDSSWNVSSRLNSKTMAEVAKVLNLKVEGVPFIVVGDSFYLNEWGETSGDKLMAAVLKEYVNDNYKDIVDPVLKDIKKQLTIETWVTIGVTILIIGGVVAVIHFGRKNEA